MNTTVKSTKPSERIREDMAFEVDVMLESIEHELALQSRRNIHPEKLARMSDFGFTSFHELTTPERVNELIKERNLVKHYQLHYPQNLFVTEEIIKTILNKYNLCNGFTKNYIGTIPEKNMDEIIAFKIRREDEEYKPWSSGGFMMNMGIQSAADAAPFQWALPSWANPMGSARVERIVETARQTGRMEEFSREADARRMFDIEREKVIAKARFIASNPYTIDQMYMKGVDPVDPKVIKQANNELVKPDLEIIAPKEMFKTDTRSRWDGRTMVTDDPIVTAKVKGGRLIVTAWDIEALIPEIQNPNKN